jgi:hypothetical protein
MKILIVLVALMMFGCDFEISNGTVYTYDPITNICLVKQETGSGGVVQVECTPEIKALFKGE